MYFVMELNFIDKIMKIVQCSGCLWLLALHLLCYEMLALSALDILSKLSTNQHKTNCVASSQEPVCC